MTYKSVLRRILHIMMRPLVVFLVKTRIGRDALYSNMPKNELVISNTDEGIHYVTNTSDVVIGSWTFKERKSFDGQHLLNTLSLINNDKSVLLDVGANIGTIGILGVSKGFFKRCIAFEPDPNNFKLLQANVTLNGLVDKFELRNEALSNESKSSLNFELSESNYGDHRIQIKKDHGKYDEQDRTIISVKSNTLDSILVNYNLNDCLLFMDTQGFEGHVLSGALSLIQAQVPIVTEFWPYGLKRSDGLEMFYSVLSTARYTSMYDLKFPTQKLKFSVDTIKKIASELGEDGAHTDLVFLND